MSPGFKVRAGREEGIRIYFEGRKDPESVLSWSEFFGWRRMDGVGSWHECALGEVLGELGLSHLEPLLEEPGSLLLTYEVMET